MNLRKRTTLWILGLAIVGGATAVWAVQQPVGPPQPVAYYCWESSFNDDGSYDSCCHHKIVINPNGTLSKLEGSKGCDSGIQENECPNDC